MRLSPLLPLAAVLLAAPHARAADRPNVLFIAVDDLRDWVGYLGKNPQTITPNIDKLAARGLAFTRSYCAAPVCNPSRASFLNLASEAKHAAPVKQLRAMLEKGWKAALPGR